MMHKNSNLRKIKKMGACMFSVTLAASMTMTLPLNALAAANTEKEENVYANLQTNGSVDGIYVVNSYDLSKSTKIVDYGTYSDVKNLTNEHTISISGDTAKVKADAGKFYYQGSLDTKNLPWKISITYYLDGKQVEASKLAGASGALKMNIKIRKNNLSDTSFCDNFLLQTAVTLDGDKCDHIQSEGATIANSGSKKLLNYNLLAGQEGDYVITADVHDFEMDQISFTGVPMSFAIDEEDLDTSKIDDKTKELTDGVSELNDGASELEDGTKSMEDGLNQYTSGVDTLYSGTTALLNGIGKLHPGVNTYLNGVSSAKEGADTLDEKTANLPALMTQLSGAIQALNSGSAKLSDADNGAAKQISDNLKKINKGLGDMKAGLNTMNAEGIQPMLDGLDTLEGNIKTLEGALDGCNNYAGKIQGIADNYEKQAEDLSKLIKEASVETKQSDSDSNLKKSDPTVTKNSSSETEEGEYKEDHTDTSKEESTDEEGNTVITITNNVYMTKTDTTTITNEVNSSTTTTVTNSKTVTNNQLSGDVLSGLSDLNKDMKVQAGTLNVLLNGDSTASNPGLITLAGSSSSGLDQIYDALYTDTKDHTSLRTGLASLQAGLVGKGGAVEGLTSLMDGIDKLEASVNGDADTSLKSSLNSLNYNLSLLDSKTSDLPQTGTALADGINKLDSGLTKLDKNNKTIKNGMSSLSSGTTKLNKGAYKLSSNSRSIISGANSLVTAMNTLSDGTQELYDKTYDINDQLKDGIQDELDEFSGKNYVGKSFVSEKNENIDAVQFVMKTESIKAEEKVEKASQKKETVMDRIKNIFKK